MEYSRIGMLMLKNFALIFSFLLGNFVLLNLNLPFNTTYGDSSDCSSYAIGSGEGGRSITIPENSNYSMYLCFYKAANDERQISDLSPSNFQEYFLVKYLHEFHSNDLTLDREKYIEAARHTNKTLFNNIGEELTSILDKENFSPPIKGFIDQYVNGKFQEEGTHVEFCRAAGTDSLTFEELTEPRDTGNYSSLFSSGTPSRFDSDWDFDNIPGNFGAIFRNKAPDIKMLCKLYLEAKKEFPAKSFQEEGSIVSRTVGFEDDHTNSTYNGDPRSGNSQQSVPRPVSKSPLIRIVGPSSAGASASEPFQDIQLTTGSGSSEKEYQYSYSPITQEVVRVRQSDSGSYVPEVVRLEEVISGDKFPELAGALNGKEGGELTNAAVNLRAQFPLKSGNDDAEIEDRIGVKTLQVSPSSVSPQGRITSDSVITNKVGHNDRYEIEVFSNNASSSGLGKYEIIFKDTQGSGEEKRFSLGIEEYNYLAAIIAGGDLVDSSKLKISFEDGKLKVEGGHIQYVSKVNLQGAASNSTRVAITEALNRLNDPLKDEPIKELFFVDGAIILEEDAAEIAANATSEMIRFNAEGIDGLPSGTTEVNLLRTFRDEDLVDAGVSFTLEEDDDGRLQVARRKWQGIQGQNILLKQDGTGANNRMSYLSFSDDEDSIRCLSQRQFERLRERQGLSNENTSRRVYRETDESNCLYEVELTDYSDGRTRKIKGYLGDDFLDFLDEEMDEEGIENYEPILNDGELVGFKINGKKDFLFLREQDERLLAENGDYLGEQDTLISADTNTIVSSGRNIYDLGLIELDDGTVLRIFENALAGDDNLRRAFIYENMEEANDGNEYAIIDVDDSVLRELRGARNSEGYTIEITPERNGSNGKLKFVNERTGAVAKEWDIEIARAPGRTGARRVSNRDNPGDDRERSTGIRNYLRSDREDRRAPLVRRDAETTSSGRELFNIEDDRRGNLNTRRGPYRGSSVADGRCASGDADCINGEDALDISSGSSRRNRTISGADFEDLVEACVRDILQYFSGNFHRDENWTDAKQNRLNDFLNIQTRLTLHRLGHAMMNFARKENLTDIRKLENVISELARNRDGDGYTDLRESLRDGTIKGRTEFAYAVQTLMQEIYDAQDASNVQRFDLARIDNADINMLHILAKLEQEGGRSSDRLWAKSRNDDRSVINMFKMLQSGYINTENRFRSERAQTIALNASLVEIDALSSEYERLIGEISDEHCTELTSCSKKYEAKFGEKIAGFDSLGQAISTAITQGVYDNDRTDPRDYLEKVRFDDLWLKVGE